MSEEKVYTEEKAERFFAIKHNGVTWSLLEKEDRTPVENELMIHAAHSSCMHWLQAGTPTHHQRGEWLLARVYCELGYSDAALRHAQMCMDLTENHPDMMQDFDKAYALEAVARVNALAGNMDAAKQAFASAEKAGDAIANAEDKKIFVSDLHAGDWHGLKFPHCSYNK